MPKLSEFDRYMSFLCETLGHLDRYQGVTDYSRGLMLPIERKSVEPLAAHIEPWAVSAKHQSLHHVVAKSEWSDEAMLTRVREWVTPALNLNKGCYWIVDDTGMPKKGEHSVGVARQYCGQLGKNENCQVAVSLSLASRTGSLPVAWQLYLPKEWTEDKARCAKVGVPEPVRFTTKHDISLAQLRAARAGGVPPGIVVADSSYGNKTGYREALTEMGLTYCVAVQRDTTVWPDGQGPLPPRRRKKLSLGGRRPLYMQRNRKHQPVYVKAVAEQLPEKAWHAMNWRAGTNAPLTGRFAAARVRSARLDHRRKSARDEQWLLIEWPKGDPEPQRYWLATLPADATLQSLVETAKMRWRIERDYQELKQEFGLGHYEGRGWRGFHHHATLCIAVFGFLIAHRLKGSRGKKNSTQSKVSALPKSYRPRGSRENAAPRPRLHRHTSIFSRQTDRPAARPMSVRLPIQN
jgi:SRSO17 transposase